jgi:predicted CXXCH cytochrome family protein
VLRLEVDKESHYLREQKSMKREKTYLIGRLVALMCVGSFIFIVACESDMFEYRPVVMTPSSIPGAEYAGAETCVECHEAESKYFHLSEHASVAIDITDEEAEAGQVEGCETCHGPGSLHNEDVYDKSKIVNANPEMCFTCHLDVKGKFMLQHHHPVPEGLMSCSDCHDTHGKDVQATGKAMLLGQDEKCFKCHKEQKGPFIFEHDAMRDGCAVCHTPHGSINDKLLVAGQTITCIRCHWEPAFNASVDIGDHGHSSGSYLFGAGDECIDCHHAPHGSNISRSLRQ